jgi:hypothetical protein
MLKTLLFPFTLLTLSSFAHPLQTQAAQTKETQITFIQPEAKLLLAKLFPTREVLSLPGFSHWSGICGYRSEFNTSHLGIRIVFDVDDDYDCGRVTTAQVVFDRNGTNKSEEVEIYVSGASAHATLRDLSRVNALRSILRGSADEMRFRITSARDDFAVDCSSPSACVFSIHTRLTHTSPRSLP